MEFRGYGVQGEGSKVGDIAFGLGGAYGGFKGPRFVNGCTG